MAKSCSFVSSHINWCIHVQYDTLAHYCLWINLFNLPCMANHEPKWKQEFFLKWHSSMSGDLVQSLRKIVNLGRVDSVNVDYRVHAGSVWSIALHDWVVLAGWLGPLNLNHGSYIIQRQLALLSCEGRGSGLDSYPPILWCRGDPKC